MTDHPRFMLVPVIATEEMAKRADWGTDLVDAATIGDETLSANDHAVKRRKELAVAWSAMLAASPPLSDADIDGLCRMMWGDTDQWSKDRAKFSWGDWPYIMKRHRKNDRARMRAFTDAMAKGR